MEISEIFHSIQGEGNRMGIPTTFIRTAGCNLRCDWCDTKYAWEEGEEMEVDEIIDKVEEIGCDEICITGGEPLIQEETIGLIDSLLEEDSYEILVETNGSINIDLLVKRDLIVSMDYKTPSSKMNDKMDHDNLAKLREGDQLKFIIEDQEDYMYAKDILKDINLPLDVILQPAGGEIKRLKWIAESVLQEGVKVRVLPQLHKMIWPDEKSR